MACLRFEADGQLGADAVAVAAVAARELLDDLPGDWQVRVFRASEKAAYGIRVRKDDEAAVQLFGDGDVRERGLRSTVRIALRLALGKMGTRH
jgi:hypothetical protein